MRATSGKTLLAQKLLEARRTTVLSMDLPQDGSDPERHGGAPPEDDAGVEAVLWPIVVGMIRTAIENRRDLIVEGATCRGTGRRRSRRRSAVRSKCAFSSCRTTTSGKRSPRIKSEASVAEDRGDDGWATLAFLLEDNARFRRAFRRLR